MPMLVKTLLCFSCFRADLYLTRAGLNKVVPMNAAATYSQFVESNSLGNFLNGWRLGIFPRRPSFFSEAQPNNSSN